MYYNSHCTSKLLNLEDVNIRNVIHSDSWVKIFVETKPSSHVFPACRKRFSKKYSFLHPSYSAPTLPNCISIDEFKRNAETGKYQCILVNPKNNVSLAHVKDFTQILQTYFIRNT